MILDITFIVVLLGLCRSQETEQHIPLTSTITTVGTNEEQRGIELGNPGALPREDHGALEVHAVSISSTEIRVEWDVVLLGSFSSDVPYYTINYAKIGGLKDKDDIVYDTPVTLSKLKPYSVYEIRVTAESRTGSFEYALATAQTFEDVPSAPPRDVDLYPLSSSAITVTWLPPQRPRQNGIIVNYRIRYRPVGTTATQIVTVTSRDENFITLTSLSSNTLYEVRLAAATVNGTGPYTQWRRVKSLHDAPEPPSAPRDFTLEPSLFSIIARWVAPEEDDSDPVTGYRLAYSVDEDEVTVTLNRSSRSYNKTGLSPDTEYTVTIYAFNPQGDSIGYSQTVRTRPQPQSPPDAPSFLLLEAEATTIHLTWSSPSDEDNVVVGYILTLSNLGIEIASVRVDGSQNSYTASGLLPGTAYTLSVTTYNNAGESSPLFESVSTLSDSVGPMPPDAPLSLLVTPSRLYVLVSWTMPEDNDDVTGFNLSYVIDMSEEEDIIEVTIDASESFYNVTNLIPDTTYIFKLVAVNDIGESYPIFANASTFPKPLEPAPPLAPSSLVLSPYINTVLVSWEMRFAESSSLEGFILGYGIISSEEKLLLIDPDQTSLIINSLEPDTSYIVSLVSFNDVGESAPVTGRVTTLPEPVELLPPQAPSSLLLVAYSTSVVVSWTPAASEETDLVTGYIITYGDENTQFLTAEETSHEVGDLEPSTEYTFEVRSYNDAGESNPISEMITTEQEYLSPCETNNGGCSHHCVPLDRGIYECQCPDGYVLDSTLNNCEDFNECHGDSQLCSGPSVECVNYPGTFACECSPGHHINDEANKFCEDINECEDDPCGSSAVCVNTFGGYECPCKTGFIYPDYEESSGGNCIDVDECEFVALIPLLCGPHALCRNTDGSYECDCSPGYIKDIGFCFDLDECAEGNPCGVNGFCENLDGSFNCSCGDGYISEEGHCVDIDECSTLEGTEDACPESMACVNYEGSYHCFCPPGFTGNGTYCEDINECTTPYHQCSEHSFCGNLEGSYYCQCTIGFVGSGRICYDVNECEGSNGGCPQHCTNTEGSFYCSCADGFQTSETDPNECEDIDECTDDAVCDQQCHNILGSYWCSCDEGYTLHINGLCVDLNECMIRNDCQEICINLPGGYECECGDMRALIANSYTHCKDVTTCEEKNGGCAQNCRKDQRGILCSCEAGSVLNTDGRTCNDVDECLASNGGCEHICDNTHGSYTCRCRRGYRRRDDNRYQCASACDPPCLNYGFCIGPDTCVCPTGYGGENCEPTCNPPCAHGGTCRRFNMCHCPVGYTGRACQKATCALPCMNGGLCIGPDTCQCSSRFTGDRCQTPKCVPGCMNGGSCYAANNCVCPRGFYGPRCQNERSWCSPGFCRHGGACIGVNKCRCTSQYTGVRCANRIPRRCTPACQNGGTCLANNRCSCPNGVAGVRCQKRTCRIEHYQTTHIEFRNRYTTELYSGACGPFGFRICNQYRLVTKRVSQIAYRAAYRSTC